MKLLSSVQGRSFRYFCSCPQITDSSDFSLAISRGFSMFVYYITFLLVYMLQAVFRCIINMIKTEATSETCGP